MGYVVLDDGLHTVAGLAEVAELLPTLAMSSRRTDPSNPQQRSAVKIPERRVVTLIEAEGGTRKC